MPLFKVIAIVITIPVILTLIYRIERFQAKFSYHFQAAKKSFVNINWKPKPQNKLDVPETKAAVFESKNNFALVTGHGSVTAIDDSSLVLRDEIFGLKFQSALRLHRRVQVYTEYKGVL